VAGHAPSPGRVKPHPFARCRGFAAQCSWRWRFRPDAGGQLSLDPSLKAGPRRRLSQSALRHQQFRYEDLRRESLGFLRNGPATFARLQA